MTPPSNLEMFVILITVLSSIAVLIAIGVSVGNPYAGLLPGIVVLLAGKAVTVVMARKGW